MLGITYKDGVLIAADTLGKLSQFSKQLNTGSCVSSSSQRNGSNPLVLVHLLDSGSQLRSPGCPVQARMGLQSGTSRSSG